MVLVVLSEDDVRRIAREEGLDEFADSLVGTVRPGWRLDLRDEIAAPPGRSKIGGDPDLAPGEPWPLNHRGIPMTFVAQLNCGELSELDDPWRARALRLRPDLLLRVFCDLIDNPFEPGLARVLATSQPGELIRSPAASIPEPWPEGGPWDHLDIEERVRALPQASVLPTAFLTAPQTHPILSPDDGTSRPKASGYFAWANRLRIDGRDYNVEDDVDPMPWDVHHFLGEPSSVQGGVRYDAAMTFEDPDRCASLGFQPDPQLADVMAWDCLLSLHDDHRFALDILDAGAYTVLIPGADLRAGTFSRAIAAIESS
jgi:hypothetical protein